MSRRKRSNSPPFIMLPHYLIRSAAWRSLTGDDRALYVEIKARYNGVNNGMIGLGSREAGEALNVSKDTARRCFDHLVERGFIRCAQESTFDQKKLSREWLLTEHNDDRTGHKATKDFARWPPDEIQKLGAPVRHSGASMRLFDDLPHGTGQNRRTHAPNSGDSEVSQAHPCATSRYTTSPVAEGAQPAEEARPSEARARRSRQAGSDTSTAVDARRGAVPVSEALVRSLAKKMRSGTDG